MGDYLAAIGGLIEAGLSDKKRNKLHYFSDGSASGARGFVCLELLPQHPVKLLHS